MINIRTRDDLRLAYFIVHELSQEITEPDCTPERKEAVTRRVADWKRAISAFLHKPGTDKIMVKDDGDGAVVRFPLPESLKTEDEADEYFREYDYMYYRPTYYDCTGQMFTSWYKIYRKDGRFWAYHRVDLDV